LPAKPRSWRSAARVNSLMRIDDRYDFLQARPAISHPPSHDVKNNLSSGTVMVVTEPFANPSHSISRDGVGKGADKLCDRCA